MSSGNEGFGLYVHWPFCISKCPYCDFNSHVAQSIDQHAWRRALLTELSTFAARTPDKILTSIFFGGGTPSLMDPASAAAIIERARASWRCANDLEITLEANPGSVDAERFAAIFAAGVNRLSMGVQALNDADLKFLGRRHGVEEARRAWRTAAKIFPRVSFDLIYARPGQTRESWSAELDDALREVADNGITHLSLYQLTMEPGTAMFDAHRRGEFALPDDDTAATLFEDTQERCARGGFPAYEISNHAAEGAMCRHNLTYWRGGDYAGVGPGAHGRLSLNGKSFATRQVKAPALWLKKVESFGHGTQEETAITPEERARELAMMGLRLHEGIDTARFARLAGRSFDETANPGSAGKLAAAGFLDITPSHVKATASGRLALNAVLKDLLA